jgi:outer membrane murein-binding lipoprotein Lpp
MALETTAKLTANVVLSAVAIAGLVKLLPYQLSQQEKLQEIQTEVQQTETRVNRLRTDFNRYFDPQQATIIMQEQSNRVAPGQRQVILVDKSTKHVEEPAHSP